MTCNWKKVTVIASCYLYLWSISPGWAFVSSGITQDLVAASVRDGLALALFGEGEVSYVHFLESGLSSPFNVKMAQSFGQAPSTKGDRIVGLANGHLAIMDLHGRPIWESHENSECYVVGLSPNGRMIAFQNRKGLQITAISSGESRIVVAAGSNTRGLNPFGETLGWSPKSDVVVFEEYNEIRLYHVPTDTVETLGPGSDPAWSPDGSTISFRAISEGYRVGRGVLMNTSSRRDADFPRLREIRDSIRWSPDSQYILYADFRANLISQFFSLVGMTQINARMVVRRVRDGVEWVLIDGGPVGLPARYQWVTIPPDMRTKRDGRDRP